MLYLGIGESCGRTLTVAALLAAPPRSEVLARRGSEIAARGTRGMDCMPAGAGDVIASRLLFSVVALRSSPLPPLSVGIRGTAGRVVVPRHHDAKRRDTTLIRYD